MAMATASPEDSWSAFLVLTLLLDESLASAALARFGITLEWLAQGSLGASVAEATIDSDGISFETDDTVYTGDGCQPIPKSHSAIDDPIHFTCVLDRATELTRRGFGDGGVSSANLLLAILETDESIRERFAKTGATLERIVAELYPDQTQAQPPLPIDEGLSFALNSENVVVDPARLAVNDAPVLRVLDANLNRAREGLRVLEDFARFLANDGNASSQLKALRHELVASEILLRRPAKIGEDYSTSETVSQRNTIGDVGTSITTSSEQTRSSLQDVVIANSRRVQESLRSLEEFGKLVSVEFSSTMKQLRYRTYTAEKTLHQMLTANSCFRDETSFVDGQSLAAESRISTSTTRTTFKSRLQAATVYVLITESMCRLPWKQVVEDVLAGGADVLQLREKNLTDRDLLRRAVWIADACRERNAIFIVNDRADIAVASGAHGVHVGQDELTVSEARRILKPEQVVGVSTHSLSQARTAVLDAADYIGVGPTFPSQTKSFEEFPGLTLVRAVASEIKIPWFPIGGITLESVSDLIAAGTSRVAVTSAVVNSDQPGSIVREFRKQLSRLASVNT